MPLFTNPRRGTQHAVGKHAQLLQRQHPTPRCSCTHALNLDLANSDYAVAVLRAAPQQLAVRAYGHAWHRPSAIFMPPTKNVAALGGAARVCPCGLAQPIPSHRMRRTKLYF